MQLDPVETRLRGMSGVITSYSIHYTKLYELPAAERYFPSWQEIGISIFVVTVGVFAFRFIVTRMPIFFEHPDYKESHH